MASSTIRNGADCLKLGASGSLAGTAQDCLGADLKGKIGKARAKVDGQVVKNCGGAGVPGFGFTDATTINDGHEDEAVSLLPDCFGPDLDAALAGPLSGDSKARCTSGAIGQAGKVADAMLKVYLGCVKSGLKDGVIVDEAGLAACLPEIVTDARGRVAKAVSRVESKIVTGCPATPGDFFPELDGPGELCDRYGLALPLNASTLSTCLRNRLRCRVCRIVNTSWGLDENCDLFDDGSIDATCPECPNGLTDPDEQCDDGNLVDGDGCTSECILEYCGDGIVNNNGTEECDDGENNSDTLPNACRLDCTYSSCGDGVVDDGEECDGGGETPTCDADCTEAGCGDGTTNAAAGEECDDSNTDFNDACVSCQNAECGDGFVRTGVEQCDGTECCTGACSYATAGTACTGTADICSSPQCNGSGTCLESPANEGASCNDSNVCTLTSICQAGQCVPDEWSGVGLACEWVVVGSSTNNTKVWANDNAVSTGGNWCGWHAELDVNVSIAGDLITADDDNNNGRGILFGSGGQVGGDIVADLRQVFADSGSLPGLIGTTTISAGQHVNKNPAPTFYDTTGNDTRIDDCEAAQLQFLTTKAALDALPSTHNLGAAYQDLLVSPPTLNPVNVGGVNVVDMTHLTGTASGVTLTISGGGNPNTVVIFRIATRMNTGPNWTFNLTNGLTVDHFMIYVSRVGGDEQCALGLNNIGGGTLFCPRVWVNVNAGTVWSGAAYGGASGLNGQVRIGQDVTFHYVPFTADLP